MHAKLPTPSAGDRCPLAADLLELDVARGRPVCMTYIQTGDAKEPRPTEVERGPVESERGPVGAESHPRPEQLDRVSKPRNRRRDR